ncbi:glycosyltransferase family A protein [Rhodospira trueperi]|uniref:Glycosyl transferase family 2 n=1 Tax=Rhodospira trueperi TaxID=69960 RepID=A0A1G7GQK0_9PROT|nr:glycosyltransferase family A protein [Rhodospira trueperi]SDE90445.1 hypothetical protein SAMN05421720_11555 [Rhodospira trueperi]
MVVKQEGVRFTFGIIVLNGEPFVRHTIAALYPHAHEIIVVEGAALAAAAIATHDGHSRDGTLETLRAIAQENDPEGKIKIVTAEDEGHPNGFWPGEKHEQSRAYAKRATGTYLWQVDVDEYYMPENIEAIRSMLATDPPVSMVTFKQVTFWGAPNVVADGWYLKSGAEIYRRLFRWGPGFQYVSHRPPTVCDETGKDISSGHVISGYDLSQKGIVLYHYSLLLPKQVQEKCEYYGAADWAARSGAVEWANTAFFGLKSPYRVHNVYEYPSWLERYHGPHPPAFQDLWGELKKPESAYALRPMDDVDHLLNSPRYRLGRFFLSRGISSRTLTDLGIRIIRRLRGVKQRLVTGVRRWM